MLNKLEKIVKDAGRIAKNDFLKSIITRYKTDRGSFTTKTDLEVEKFIVRKLKKILPNSGFHLEEGKSSNLKSKNVWVIDPVDGTHNFHLGIPNFSISVALLENNIPKIAVIYNPISNQLYKAAKSKGAYINNQKITVSKCQKLDKVTLAYAQGYAVPRYNKILGFLQKKLIYKIERYMNNWAVALDFCLLARGVVDAIIDLECEIHDLAAGYLIAKEAGAKITDFNGKEVNFNAKKILATNNTKLHDYILAELKKIKY